MRTLILIAAVVLASASAQAGESRSLSADPISDVTTAGSPPAASTSLRADNDAAMQPAETPRYSPPPGEATSNPPPAETPHYTARPAPVDNARPTRATAAQTPDDAYSPHGDHSSRAARSHYLMRAERPHHRHWTVGRIIATLHHYGIYW